MTQSKISTLNPVSRRALLKGTAVVTTGLGTFSFNGTAPFGFVRAFADVGTYPAGSSGPAVTIGAAVPRTGTYAAQGEDELPAAGVVVYATRLRHHC